MGHQVVTYTFTIDQGLLALALMSVTALIGVGLIIYGFLLITHRLWETRWLARESMARDLASWSSDVAQTAEQQSAILSQLTSLMGWAILGAGLGWLLATIGVCALAFSATGTLASLIADGATVVSVLQSQGAALGMTLGFLIGSWRATHRLTATQTYADLRRRRPSDYRAGWVAWGPSVITLCALGPLWLLATQTTHVSFTLCGERWTFPTTFTVAVFLGLGAMIPVATALCVRWLVSSPRTLLASDPLVARGADDYRRAVSIGAILGLAWMSCGNLLQSAMSIATTNGVGREQPIEAPLLTVAYFLGTGAVVTGLLIIALHGRLGGELTRWRRQNATSGRTGELAHD